MDELQADGFPATEDTEREVAHESTREPGPGLSAPSGPGIEGDPLLNLLVRWEEAHARGEDPTPETLCGDELHWLPVLRERIAKRKRLRRILAMPAAGDDEEGERPLPEFPGHEVEGQIGRGGMGVVYRARDVRLGRVVALKTLAEARYATREQVERFLDEARAVARLRHPNIMAIHAIGEHEGRPYLSLEYLEGGSLAQRLANGPMAPRPAAALVETLARAVEVAHRAGVVHRDLKPGNVLLTAEGVPKVGDFGLAKLMDSDSALTCSGQVMGTPSYMAPEQAEGHSSRVGPPADVYALGAILYQSLTGRPPFLGHSALETIRLAATTDAVPPTRLRPEVSRDLETVCLKCLEKDPGSRYESAAGLADDLRRFLDGRPILARPVSQVGRMLRWAGRNPRLAMVSGLLVAMFALGAPGFFALWVAADRARGRAVSALDEAEQAHLQADTARGRAVVSRDLALRAIDTIVRSEYDGMMSEEHRPYREALTTFGLREAEDLVRSLEGDPKAEMQVIFGHLALARVQLESGRAEEALESGRKALALAEALDARRHTEESRLMLASTLHRLCIMPGKPADSRAYAERSNAIYEAVYADRPDGPKADSHSIAMNHYNIGHTWYMQGNLPAAMAAFESSIRVCEEALRRGDESGMARHQLARALVYVCRSRLNSGRCADAVEPGRRAVAIYRELLERSPQDFSLVEQLYLAHEELCFAFMGLQRRSDVIACHESARAMLKAAAGRHKRVVSRMAGIQGMLAVVDFNLANVYGADIGRHYREYRALFDEAYEICDKLELVEPLSDMLKTVLLYGLYQRADLRVEDGKVPDPTLLERADRVCQELCVAQPWNGSHRAMRILLGLEEADELESLGRTAEASKARERAFAAAPGDGGALFEAAQASADNAASTGTYPTRLDARRMTERRRLFARRAVGLLRRAVAAGFHDAARIAHTPGFAVLGDDPEFRSVMASIGDRVFPEDPFAARP